MASSVQARPPLRSRNFKGGRASTEAGHWRMEGESEQSIIGQQFAHAITLMATGHYDEVMSQQVKEPPVKIPFWEDPKYNPPLANTHMCYEHDSHQIEQQRYWKRTGNKFMTGKRIDPPNFEGPLKYYEVPHTFERPIPVYGRKREVMPYQRAKAYQKPVSRMDPTNSMLKAMDDERTAMIGPTTYKQRDPWKDDSYGSLPNENSVFCSTTKRFPDPKGNKVDFHDEKAGRSIPHDRGRSRGGGFWEPPTRTSVARTRAQQLQQQSKSFIGSGENESQPLPHYHLQPQPTFVALEPRPSLASLPSFQAAPVDVPHPIPLPHGPSSASSHSALDVPPVEPSIELVADCQSKKDESQFGEDSISSATRTLESSVEAQQRTQQHKQHDPSLSVFEELNVFSLRSPLLPDRYYQISAEEPLPDSAIASSLDNSQDANSLGYSLPAPMLRRASNLRRSQEMDESARRVMQRISEVTLHKQVAGKSKIPGYSFARSESSTDFGANENEKVYRRVKLDGGTLAVMPMVPADVNTGISGYASTERRTTSQSSNNPNSRLGTPATNARQSNETFGAEKYISAAQSAARTRSSSPLQGGGRIGSPISFRRSRDEEIGDAHGVPFDVVDTYSASGGAFAPVSIPDLSIPAVPIPPTRTPPTGKPRKVNHTINNHPDAAGGSISGLSLGTDASINDPYSRSLPMLANINTAGIGNSSTGSLDTMQSQQAQMPGIRVAVSPKSEQQRRGVSIITIMDDESSVNEPLPGAMGTARSMYTAGTSRNDYDDDTNLIATHSAPVTPAPENRSYGTMLISGWTPPVQFSNRRKNPIPNANVEDMVRRNIARGMLIQNNLELNQALNELERSGTHTGTTASGGVGRQSSVRTRSRGAGYSWSLQNAKLHYKNTTAAEEELRRSRLQNSSTIGGRLTQKELDSLRALQPISRPISKQASYDLEGDGDKFNFDALPFRGSSRGNSRGGSRSGNRGVVPDAIGAVSAASSITAVVSASVGEGIL